MRTRAKQKFVAKATTPGAKVPQAQLVVLRNAAAVFYAGFSFFRAVVLEDKNSENYNERTRGKGGAYDSDCSL